MEAHSLICTGSSLNRRTFHDEESWSSLQSTILAGHLKEFEETKELQSELEQRSKPNLSVLHEEKITPSTASIPSASNEESFSVLDDDNVFNMNLDAMSDSDVFYDCPSPSKKLVMDTTPPSFLNELSGATGSEESHEPNLGFPTTLLDKNSDADSGFSQEWTGALLAQIADDFAHLNDHAQSTPKDPDSLSVSSVQLSSAGSYASPIGEPITAKLDSQVKTILSFSPCSESKARSRENSNFSCPGISVSKWVPSPSLANATNKVARVKKIFESQAEPTKETKLALRARKSQNAGTQSARANNRSNCKPATSYSSQVSINLTAQSSRSSTTPSSKKSSKLKRSPNWRTLASIEAHKCRMLKNQIKYLSPDSAKGSVLCHSCEIFSEDSLEISNIRARSHSDSDALPNNPSLIRLITVRKKRSKSPKISKIMSRRSIGFVSSPIKPVREIRKIYSPKQKVNQRFVGRTSSGRRIPKIVCDFV